MTPRPLAAVLDMLARRIGRTLGLRRPRRPARRKKVPYNEDQPGYRSTFSAAADAGAVRFEGTFAALPGKNPVANVMVWIDGVPVATLWDSTAVPPRSPHPMTATPTGTPGEVRVAGSVLRSALPLAAGPRELVVSAWAWPSGEAEYEPMVYRREVLTLPPVATAPLVPGRVARVMLWSEPGDLVRLGWVGAYKDAGFNAVHGEFFKNPCYTGAASVGAFRESSVVPLVAKLEWCRANGLLFWGVGDAVARMPVERQWVQDTPWAEQAVRETFAVRRRFPEVWVAASMVDEQPGHPDDWPYYRRIHQWAKEEGGPPLSWPNQRAGLTDPWEAPDVADFADRYYSANGTAWRGGRPAGANGQPTTWQFAAMAPNLEATRPGVPLAFVASAMGPNYFKRVEGSNYRPGDYLLRTGSPPEAIPLQVFLPMALAPVTALRVYALDTLGHVRTSGPLGSEQQEACRPGSPEWDALAECNRAVERHEAALLGEWLPPGRVGHWAVGRRPGLTFWVNASDSAEACPGGPGGEPVLGGRVVIYRGQ